MGLPLISGIFPVFIIAGVLATAAGNSSVAGIPQTGLLIFGGLMTVATILAEIDDAYHERLTSIPLLGVLPVPVAVAEATVVETVEMLLSFGVFHRFVGLVVLTVAAKTASSKVGEYLPSPSIIIGLGLVANSEPAGFEPIVAPDPMRLLSADAAAGAGVGFAGAVALFTPRLRGNVGIDLFHFGSSVTLDMPALDVLGLVPTQTSVALGVPVVTVLFAFGPGLDGADLDEFVNDASVTESATSNANTDGMVADDGDDADPANYDVLVDDANETDDSSELGYGHPDEEESYTPWL